MNLSELEDELTVLEDALANLQLEIDVCHRPSASMLSERNNLISMAEGVRNAIERVLSTESDPNIDYDKTRAYDAFIAYYARTVRIEERHCRKMLEKYASLFETAYDDGIRDPASLFLVVRKHV